MKEMQRNWIGKSEGARLILPLKGGERNCVYTHQPRYHFGVDFMVIAPEHELVDKITSTEQQTAIDDYLKYVKSRSERERLAEAKTDRLFHRRLCHQSI